ncbi:MAG: acyl carrier protein [Gemmatimonadota bacterium]|nr:acyl carrier protein [Gemmatimonadota bacterium]
MNTETIQETVKEIMASIFSIDASNIDADASLGTVPAWDSLQHLNLMMALEQAFGVRISIEDAVDMTTFPAVCETLKRYLEQRD